AGDGRQAVELARQLRPDVVVCDVTMPSLNGIEVARQIHDFAPQVSVIILSVHSDNVMVSEALKAGAKGYVLKTSAASELTQAVRAAAKGATYLSPRVAHVAGGAGATGEPRPNAFSSLTVKQRQVLQLLAEGKSNKEVAAA